MRRLHDLMAGGWPSARHPFARLTVRARMALLYGLVSAVVGIVPVGLICVLVEHDLGSTVVAVVSEAGLAVKVQSAPAGKTSATQKFEPTSPSTSVLAAGPTAMLPTEAAQRLIILDGCPANPPAANPPAANPPAATKAGATKPAATEKLGCANLTGRFFSAREASAAQLGGSISDRLVQQLVEYSAIALAALVLIAFGLGWWLAGRALRPVHQMAAAVRLLSWANLHERIPLHRPKDELRELGETFNALLDRLGAAFTSQQRFVANAAHELRTPLAIQRATIQIGLGDFPVEETELAAVREELLAANRRHEQLIDGLLLLARGEGGLEHREPVDLAELTEDAVSPLAAQAREQSVELTVCAEPATVDGDLVLLSQLVTNLVQNAIRYNRIGGRVEVRVAGAELTVTNTGPEIAPEAVDGLFEPFRRLHRDRTGSASGAGLGLSIVRSIVAAHGGSVSAEPNRVGGGLTVRVRLPVPSHPQQTAVTADLAG